ncbi:hypothetical protein BN59_03594 [Legionella massiliensis]|uniref:Uncharacterized protein n=2 Tax=Legionella massiliensis TaxID=1034943 RepID=A0A078L259_9GAMM|nr:hypothetical protein BN59_03594 [Legionella massiliensis]CEE15014.1 hypothetical protein BN1094_03594 [Legionella massiliensis]
MKEKDGAAQPRTRDECLAAINAHTFLANRSLMLRDQSEYVEQIQNLAQACAEIINQHHMQPVQLTALIEGKIAATQGQHLQAVLAEIRSCQMQRRALDNNAFFNPAAHDALNRKIDGLNASRNTSIAEIQRGIVTDTFVRAHQGHQANIPANFIYNYEPPNPEQPDIGRPG